MESFEQRLKHDADDIRAQVTPELDDRIRASLENVVPMQPREEPKRRPNAFWWASSLTGAAAAAVVLTVMNLGEEPASAPPPSVAEVPLLAMPNLDVRPAMLAPLETELENLKGDLERAERVVREDLDKILGESPP